MHASIAALLSLCVAASLALVPTELYELNIRRQQRNRYGKRQVIASTSQAPTSPSSNVVVGTYNNCPALGPAELFGADYEPGWRTYGYYLTCTYNQEAPPFGSFQCHYGLDGSLASGVSSDGNCNGTRATASASNTICATTCPPHSNPLLSIKPELSSARLYGNAEVGSSAALTCNYGSGLSGLIGGLTNTTLIPDQTCIYDAQSGQPLASNLPTCPGNALRSNQAGCIDFAQ